MKPMSAESRAQSPDATTGREVRSAVSAGTVLVRAAHEATGRFAVIPVMVGVLVLAQVLNSQFLTWPSINLMLRQNASLGLIAIGLTFVLIGGGIDISVGALYAAGASVYTKVALDHSLLTALCAAIATGVVGGVVNGLLVTKLKFSPFVATLGTASLFGGLVVLYAGNLAIAPTNPAFRDLARGDVLGVSNVVIALLVIGVVAALVLHRTAFGKSLYAVGGSFSASYVAGLRTDSIRLVTYVISGACATFAGVIYASQTGISQSDLGGSVVALTTIAIVVLGGTSLYGGEGAIWRTAAGFMILASVTTIFTMLAVDEPLQEIVQGAIVVGALILDASGRKRAVA
ncbi:ABC transporter permease [Nocardioides sp.]|uniref:ABC transporter permease n=1 Tax=Nocardioides sp. TaxID=35761 RepID=UPI003D137129